MGRLYHDLASMACEDSGGIIEGRSEKLGSAFIVPLVSMGHGNLFIYVLKLTVFFSLVWTVLTGLVSAHNDTRWEKIFYFL